LLKYSEFSKYETKLGRRKAWFDENYLYMPIINVKRKNYSGVVFNLEVEDDNSYVTDSFIVHNCWTPWFGLLGSMSGYDSVDECYGPEAKHIHALETGLSSDPAMNWRCSWLDRFTLISNSDSHSPWPWRMGRECNVFDIKPSYNELINAIRTRNNLLMTIEVDPAYGKYHWDGHRAHNFSSNPAETKALNGICPVCHKPLTIGVESRVEELADRPAGFKLAGAVPYKKLIPLAEIISALTGRGVATKGVWAAYQSWINRFGSEFNIMLDVPEAELLEFDKPVAEAIIKTRNQEVIIKPGYDGEYGVPLFNDQPPLPSATSKPKSHPLSNGREKPSSKPQPDLTSFL
jgi:uncharacterized protein (TIGR00375 family)